ncbi:MAG: TonB-dependent receptor plug domain-containing protein [Maricaulaceae bacterium]
MPFQHLGAIAQETLPFELRSSSYDFAYFEIFQPRTARDMVARLPGFTLSGSEDDGQRGFGQATLNILINGRRPSSKSSGADTILQRIPADTVLRIDIRDGASLGIPGLSGKVADIITKSDEDTFSGNWNYAARFEEGTEPQLLDGDISINGTKGDLSYVANFTSGQFTFTQEGDEFYADGMGRIFENRREDIFIYINRPSASINLTYESDNDHVANLNLTTALRNYRGGRREFFVANTGMGSTRTGQNGQTLIDHGEDEHTYEISGDYSRPAFGGKLKFIGLHRYADDDTKDALSDFITSNSNYTSIFDRRDKKTEYIARSEYNFKTSARHEWQFALEGSYNSLKSKTGFRDTSTPISTNFVRVDEERAEGHLTHYWNVSDRLNLQSSIGAEYSRLDVPTAAQPARDFVRPKGFVSASYNASDKYVINTKVERDVGQLNFGTFVTAVDLSNSYITSGNPLIVPEQFWKGEIEVERNDDKLLSGGLKVFAQYIEDPIDRIALPGGTEAPGNLTDAWFYGVEGNATFLLDDILAKGMRLEASGALRDSEIKDPLTNQNRRINSTVLWDYNASFRHDIEDTPYAYGASLELDRISPFYRLDQTLQGNFDRPNATVFATHKAFLGMQASIKAQNLLNQKTERPRFIYQPDRTGSLYEFQNFGRQNGRRISLELSGTF